MGQVLLSSHPSIIDLPSDFALYGLTVTDQTDRLFFVFDTTPIKWVKILNCNHLKVLLLYPNLRCLDMKNQTHQI